MPDPRPGPTVAALRVIGTERDGRRCDVRLALSSRAENVTVVRQALAGLADATGLSRADLNDIGTAVTEACNNVSSHAYEGREGPLEVELRTNAATVVVTVRDRGVGIAWEDDSAVEFPSDVDGELAGIGLPSIKALTSSARWSEPAGGGTEVEMTFATAQLAPQIPGSGNGRGRQEDEPGELSAGEPSWHADAVEVGMTPVAVARRVLPRLLRVMASRARFCSSDRRTWSGSPRRGSAQPSGAGPPVAFGLASWPRGSRSRSRSDRSPNRRHRGWPSPSARQNLSFSFLRSTSTTDHNAWCCASSVHPADRDPPDLPMLARSP